MEAKLYRVASIDPRPGEPEETWGYFLPERGMTPAEQEVVRDSNLRTKASGYRGHREALDAAKIDAADIRRAAKARAVEV